MKKILFATTALVATAGVAAADLNFSGYGRFGLNYTEGAAEELRLDQRLRLIITGTAESDGGLAFTAQTRIQWDDAASTPGDAVNGASAAIRDAAFHVAYGGLTLSLGNVSAAEATPGFYAGCLGYTGYTCVDPWNSIGYGNHDIGLTTAGTNGVVMLTYTTGDLTGRVSYSNDGAGTDRTHVGVDYKFGDYLIALSHQEESGVTNNDISKLYIQGALGNTTFGLFADDSAAGNAFGVTATTSIGAATTATLTAVSLAAGGENIGVGINHSLGGGVSFGAGISDLNGTTYGEAGVVFSF
ncbi:porin [Shimia sp.]|uniref:porin n=1 Tax=Shimia sp. TaxID=1954381 RepID=UPI003566019E